MFHYDGNVKEVTLVPVPTTCTLTPLTSIDAFGVAIHFCNVSRTGLKIAVPLLPVAARNLSDQPNSARKFPSVVRCSLVETLFPVLYGLISENDELVKSPFGIRT
jgi:hypothetical protein